LTAGDTITVGLPYYRLVATQPPGGSGAFYSEAYFTPRAGLSDFFALASPGVPGDRPAPAERLLRPLLPPSEHARRAEEALRAIREHAWRGPSFEFGGLRGMFKAMLYYLSGQREKAAETVRATGSLEWNLAYDYVSSVLGLRAVERLEAAELVYARLTLRRVPGGFEAYIWRGGRPVRFRVLEVLAGKHPGVMEGVEALLA